MNCSTSGSADHCTCTYPCDKRGNCCKCVVYHREKGEIPGCFFTAEGEKGYDRSLKNFLRDRSGA